MLLSIGQAALAIGVSVSTLRRWEREKRISPTHKTAGGHRRYLLRELQSVGKSCGAITNGQLLVMLVCLHLTSVTTLNDKAQG